jgi:hypothetical protein
VVSERRKIGLVEHRYLFLRVGQEIPEECSELTRLAPESPNMNERVADVAGRRGVSIGRSQRITPAPGPFFCIVF